MKLAIIGQGMAGQVFYFSFVQKWLEKKSKEPLEVYFFGESDLAPVCSFNTTGMIFLGKAQKGVGKLGDVQYHSFGAAKKFIQKYQPGGIVEGERHILSEGKMTQEETFFVTPPTFFQWIEEKVAEQIKSRPEIKIYRHKKFVKSISEDEINSNHQKSFTLLTKCEEKFAVDKVVVCSGAYFKSFSPVYDPILSLEKKNWVDECKYSPGSFLEFSHIDWGNKTFCYKFSDEGISVIYRHKDKAVQIGTVNLQNDLIFFHDREQLEEMYHQTVNLLKNDWILPPFSKIAIKTGVRLKGKQRKPFWGKLDDNVYGVLALYKNGMSYSFLAAEELTTKMT